ncbi:MAG: hypothetical protein IPL08_20960 [Saprospiraceae bacterium]|nr:hypothetical protein [Saprospiraceae bacterium]
MKYLPFYILLIFVFCMTACKDGFYFNKKAKDPILASVGERNLFKSQVDGLIHDGTSPTDSAAIVDGFVQNWIRENLMITEAESNVAADINLNKLIDDYRSSLLVYNYENKLIDKKLDTLLTYAEKKAYYDANKNQYVLSHPVFKCIIAKIPAKVPGLSSVKTALNKSDMTEALFLIKEKAVYHHIDTAMFLTIEDLKSLVPADMINSKDLSNGKVIQKKEKEFEYFVKILKYYDENKIPPFDYIEGKITKTILSERKIQLLKTYRQELYEKGIAEKKFEIYKQD